MGFSNSSENALLQRQSEIFSRLLPDAVVIATLAIVGALGNIMAAVFYTRRFKRTTTLTLIIALTLNDFVVCILFIPNFVEIELNVNNSHTFLCKVTHFLNQFFVSTSCTLLGVISIDRYRRICKPFGKQIPTSAVKYAIPCVFFFSLCSAARKIVDYDTIEVHFQTSNNNLTTVGYFCTNTNDPDLQTLVSSFYVVDVILALTIWITVIVAYSKAINTVTKQRRKDRKVLFRKRSRAFNDTGTGNESDTFGRTVMKRPVYHIYGMDISDNQISIISDGHDGENINISTDSLSEQATTNNISEKATSRKTNNAKRICKKSITKNVSRLEQNLTYMMFTASVLFLLSFAPFFTVKLVMRKYIENIADYELQPGIQFVLKLPLVNSVFTPIIYCIFNSKFRQFLTPKFRKFCMK